MGVQVRNRCHPSAARLDARFSIYPPRAKAVPPRTVARRARRSQVLSNESVSKVLAWLSALLSRWHQSELLVRAGTTLTPVLLSSLPIGQPAKLLLWLSADGAVPVQSTAIFQGAAPLAMISRVASPIMMAVSSPPAGFVVALQTCQMPVTPTQSEL